MTEAEAKIVAEIVKTADGGCCVCVGHLAGKFQYRFPSFDWAALTLDRDEGEKDWRERVEHARASEEWDNSPAGVAFREGLEVP